MGLLRWCSAIARAGLAHPGRVILAVSLLVACVHIGGYSVRGVRPRIVRGDAVHYYVYTRSIVFDRDVSFENDYIGLYSLDFQVEPPAPGFTWQFKRTPTGLVRNYMAIGTPLTWLPLYLGTSGAVALWNWGGGHYPLDGYGLAFQFVPTICGLVAGGLGLWLTFLLCREFVSARYALAGTLTAFAGTSYLYYMLVAPSYSHAVSACFASAFFLYWWRTRDRTGIWRYVGLGLIGGALTLVRWQDALALSVAAFDVLVQGRRLRTWPERLTFGATRLCVSGVAALIVFTPQMLVWQSLYGQALTIPQGGDFMRWSAPAIGAVLVSPLRGLFSWTPIAAAGLVALPWLWRRSPRFTVALMSFFLASIYVNAAVVDWWAGEAFGARRFLSSFPIMAVGCSVLVSRHGAVGAASRWLAPALVGANLLLLLHYELFMLGYRSLAAYPDQWSVLWVDRFVTPFRLLASLF